MRMSFSVSLFFPETVMTSEAVETFIASSLTLHLPSLSDTTDFSLPANATVTLSPGSAVP